MFNADDIKKIRQSIDSGQTYVSKVNKTSPVLPQAPKININMPVTPLPKQVGSAQYFTPTSSPDYYVPKTTGQGAGRYTKPSAMDLIGTDLKLGTMSALNAPGKIAHNLGATKYLPKAFDMTQAIQSEEELRAKQQRNIERLGDSAPAKAYANFVSPLVSTIPALAADTATMALTGGLSTAPKVGATASQLVANILKQPVVAQRITRYFSEELDNGLKSGASKADAIRAAIMYSVPSAIIEGSGGIDTVVADAVTGNGRTTAGKFIKELLLKTAPEEAREEAMQNILQGTASKATYQPQLPTFSTTEQAVINPYDVAKAAASGYVGGALLGGTVGGINSIANQPSLPQVQQVQQPIPQVAKQQMQLPPPRWYVNPDGNVANDPAQTWQADNPTKEPIKARPTTKMLPQPKMYVDPQGNVANELTLNEKKLDPIKGIDFNPVKNEVYQEYNDAIEQIQNHFGTNELRGDEVEQIKTDLGIDIMDIAYRMEQADKLDELTSEQRFEYLDQIGVADYFYGKETADQYRYLPNQTPPDYKVRHGRQVIDGYVKPQAETPHEPPTPDYKARYAKQVIQRPQQALPTMQTNQQTPSLPLARSQNGTLPQATNNNLPTQPQPITGQNEAAVSQSIDSKTQLPKPSNKVELGTNKNKPTFKDALNKFYTATVDTQSPIGRFSKTAKDDTATLASNSRNVGGTVNYILTDALVDRNGNKIGKSLKEVSSQIPQGQEQSFWDYFSHLHNIDRAREGKNVIANYTPEMSQEYVNRMDKDNPNYSKVAREISDWIDTMTKEWGVSAGTIDSEVYGQLRETYKNYFPTQREFSQLEKSVPGSVRRQFVDTSSPLKKASGSSRDINNPIENIMSLVDRTVKTARYNEVGQSLLESIRKNPEALSDYAQEIEMDEGKVSKANNVVTVLENGKPVYLQINDKDLLLAMNGLPKIINNAKAMRAVTRVFKGLITQWNPFFAVRNVARDVPTAYVYGSESNPAKFLGGLFKSVKDIVVDAPEYQRYKAVGGGSSNFFSPYKAEQAAQELQKKPSLPKKIGGTIARGIETINSATETAPRLAEFNRVFNKTGDVQKALAAANDVTVNFARGGNATKSAEPFVPYLNAGVQGIDKFFREFKNPKVALRTIVRSGIAITLPEVALYLINKDDDEYKKLDNRTKDTYFLIPKGDGTFYKIPKSRELGVLFGSLFQRTFRQMSGENESFKGFAKTALTNFAPANPIENNFFSPIYNLKSNKDFADRTIVPMGMQMDKRSPYLQYDEKTTEIAKAIGKHSAKFIDGGLSPKQIDYLIRSYTGVIATVIQPLTTQGQSLPDMLSRQFFSDPLYSNEILNDFYEELDELTQNATDKNITENIPGEASTPEEKVKNSMLKISKEISALQKEKNKAQAQGNTDRVDSLQKHILQKAERGLLQIDRESKNVAKITQYLNSNQKATFSKNKDDASLKYVSAVTTNKAYNKITDNQKDKASSYAYNYSVALAETKVSLKKLDGWYKDASELEKKGYRLDTLLIAKAVTSGVEGTRGDDGKFISLSAARNKKAAVDKLYGNKSLDERKVIYEFCGIAKSVWYE